MDTGKITHYNFLNMNLGELKQWVNSLPAELDGFEMVNGEIGMLGDQYHYRVDKPIVACTIDEETKEVIFMHQAEKELTEEDLKTETDGTEQA
jgi:hypothetical protein